MSALLPLTAEEREFASEHYGLVIRYLRFRKLPEDDYYDIAVFGYLRAVKSWFSDDGLRQYSFATIAFQSMRSSVGNHQKQQQIRKEKYGAELSLNAPLGDTEAFTLEDVIPDPRDFREDVEAREIVRELLEYLTPRKRAAVFARLAGYDTSRGKLIKI